MWSLRQADLVFKMGSDEAFVAEGEAKVERNKMRLNDRMSVKRETAFKFGQRRGQHNLEHGLTSEARRVAAEAEEGYRLTSDSLQQRPGGLTGGEEVKRIDPSTGEEVIYRRYAAPFGETFVPSTDARFAFRNQIGQLSNTTNKDSWQFPEHRDVFNPSLLAERRVRHLLEAGELPLSEKIDLLGSAMSDVFRKQLPLQPKVWTALFTVWGQAHAEPLVEAYSQKQLQLTSSTMASLPKSTTSDPIAPEHVPHGGLLASTQSLKCLDWMKEAYFHMRSGFTAPTPQIMESLMGALALSGATDQPTVHLAHRILLDADRYVTLPTRTTYAAYFDICNRCEIMHFAVKRFADAIDNLFIEPDAAMATALLRGLHENGLVEEAIAMLARMQRIDADVQFLNASMETLLLSQDARAVLASYEAVVKEKRSIVPSSDTFTLMLLACERLADWTPVRNILSEMQLHRVKGDAQCLNLLLKGLLLQKMNTFAHQLYLTMRLKRIDVWPAVEAVLPSTITNAVATLSRKSLKRLTKQRQFLRGNEPFALTKQVVADAMLLKKSLHLDEPPRTTQTPHVSYATSVHHQSSASGHTDASFPAGNSVKVGSTTHDGSVMTERAAVVPPPQQQTSPVMIDLDALLADTNNDQQQEAHGGIVLPQQRIRRRGKRWMPRPSVSHIQSN